MSQLSIYSLSAPKPPFMVACDAGAGAWGHLSSARWHHAEVSQGGLLHEPYRTRWLLVLVLVCFPLFLFLQHLGGTSCGTHLNEFSSTYRWLVVIRKLCQSPNHLPESTVPPQQLPDELANQSVAHSEF